MRIALLAPEYPGCGPSFGIGRYFQILVEGLVAAGHRTLLLVVCADGCYRSEDGARPERQADAAGAGLLRPARQRTWIQAQLVGWRPDVLEYSNWGGLAAWLRPPCPGLCRLSSSVALTPTPGWRGGLRHLHLLQERLSVRRATRVLADSRSAATMGRRLYGRGVDGIVFHGLPDAAQPAPSTSRRDVLFIGRLEPRKGIDHLLRAWPLIHHAAPATRLHVVGADPRALAQRLGHPGLVFHGRLDDAALATLKQRCLVQVVPSRFESFGLVVLEAWRDGLAVVANAVAALAEIVPGGGRLVDASDRPLLAAAVVDLLLDPATADRLAAAGFRRLRRDFTVERFVEQSVAWYRRCR